VANEGAAEFRNSSRGNSRRHFRRVGHDGVDAAGRNLQLDNAYVLRKCDRKCWPGTRDRVGRTSGQRVHRSRTVVCARVPASLRSSLGGGHRTLLVVSTSWVLTLVLPVEHFVVLECKLVIVPPGLLVVPVPLIPVVLVPERLLEPLHWMKNRLSVNSTARTIDCFCSMSANILPRSAMSSAGLGLTLDNSRLPKKRE